MTIRFRCKCGQQWQANDTPAGRVAKCPRCGEALHVPASTSAARPAVAGRPPNARATIAAEQPDQPCPSCGKLLSSGTVLCVDCGYHLKRGKTVRRATAKSSVDEDSDVRRDSAHRRRGAVFGKALCRVSVAILVGVLGSDSDEEKKMSWNFLGAFVGGLAGFFVAKYWFGGFDAGEFNLESVAAALFGAPVGAVLGWIGGGRFADYLDSGE